MAEATDEAPVTLPDGEYAIAEIMGHSTMIGRFTEVERFGTKMLCIEPIWENKLLAPVYVGGASLYRFTPCSKEVAQARQPRERYQLPPAVVATLPPPALQPPEPNETKDDLDFAEVEELPRDEIDDEIRF